MTVIENATLAADWRRGEFGQSGNGVLKSSLGEYDPSVWIGFTKDVSVAMITQVAATFAGGQFKPDESIPLAENTRVNLIVEVIGDEAEPETDPHRDPQKSIAAWEALKAFLKKHPIHGGGKRYARDELYERR